MLKILNDCIVFFKYIYIYIYTWVPLYKRQSVYYKYVCHTSKQGEPKAHILLHINSPSNLRLVWDQLKVVNQSMKAFLRMRPSEDIYKLIFRGDWEHIESTMDKIITDKITIDLDVFSLFMEDIIVSNMNDTLVIIIKRNNRGCGHT